MMNPGPESGISQHLADLASSFADREFRASYFAQHLRMFLADQIRGLRGDMSQAEFGRVLNKPQSVVSRIEDEEYGRVSLQTLIDVAQSLDIGLIIKFVDFPTFLRETADMSDEAIVPRSYTDDQMSDLLQKDATTQPTADGTARSMPSSLHSLNAVPSDPDVPKPISLSDNNRHRAPSGMRLFDDRNRFEGQSEWGPMWDYSNGGLAA